jgi:hypothetical protein
VAEVRVVRERDVLSAQVALDARERALEHRDRRRRIAEMRERGVAAPDAEHARPPDSACTAAIAAAVAAGWRVTGFVTPGRELIRLVARAASASPT